MTITTEEVETLARQLDANEPMVQDPVAIEFFGDVATALRNLAAERDTAIARAEAAEEAFAGALANLADASRARGEAEGRLAASEMAGIVEGWKTRAEKAEAEAEKLREALKEYLYQTTSKATPKTIGGREYRDVLIPYSAIRTARAALNQGGDDDREKAKRHHHDGIPDGLLMRGD